MTEPQPVSGRRLAAFSAVAVATGSFNIPLQAYLPAFYAATMGLGLQSVGLVFLASRLWSAFADPVIGWLSDRTSSRYGRRKPWIVGGGALFLISTLAVFLPPAGAGLVWLGIGLLGLCLGWTAVSTPLYAWGGEMAGDPRQRARVQAYIQTAASIGIFLILLMPALFDLLQVGDPALRVHAMGLFVALALATGVLLIVTLFHEAPSAREIVSRPHWRDGLRAVCRDPALWRIILSDFFVSLGQGARGAVFVLFVTHYMGLRIASLLLLVQFSFGIFASPIWARISYLFGRKRTLILGEALQVGINLPLLLLTPGRAWLLILLVVAQGLAQGSGNLMLRAMIYDVADRHWLASGIRRAGLFSSIFNITTNAAMATSVALAFLVLGGFGFAPGAGNGPRALGALLGVFALGPALGHALSILAIYKLPIGGTGAVPSSDIETAAV